MSTSGIELAIDSPVDEPCERERMGIDRQRVVVGKVIVELRRETKLEILCGRLIKRELKLDNLDPERRHFRLEASSPRVLA
jgi:hypothetical protein